MKFRLPIVHQSTSLVSLDRNFDRYWFTRHYIGLSTLATFAIALLSPDSLNGRAVDAAGPVGWWVVAILAVVSFIALMEAFFTTFMCGDRMWWFREHRHVGFMLIAIGQLCLAYLVVEYSSTSSVLVIRFSVDAFAATFIAFLDMFARHRKAHSE